MVELKDNAFFRCVYPLGNDLQVYIVKRTDFIVKLRIGILSNKKMFRQCFRKLKGRRMKILFP